MSDVNHLTASLSHTLLPHTRAGIRHVLRESAIADLAHDVRLVSMAKEVLGGEAVPYRATLFDKSPEANWLVVWHQDIALPLEERREVDGWGPWSVKENVNYANAPASALEQVLAIRFHLDDSTSENGPLRVLPGTHNQGVLSDKTIQDLSKQITPKECTVSRGGVVLMRPLLIHASSKSRSEMSRRVIHIEYSATPAFGNLKLARA